MSLVRIQTWHQNGVTWEFRISQVFGGWWIAVKCGGKFWNVKRYATLPGPNQMIADAQRVVAIVRTRKEFCQ